MTAPVASTSPRSPALALISRVLRWLDGVPYTVLAIPLRLAVATVFWNSAMTKLANWDTAVALFVDEYKLPLLPPELVAYVAVSIELTTPVLLVTGLFTRVAALALLGMTAVIEIFVYPLAWPTHLQWAAMLFVLLCRGPGRLSVDHWLWKRFGATLGG
ncbi:MAG TPA: DoxX family protein [Casimicrobiaceae bacterium]